MGDGGVGAEYVSPYIQDNVLLSVDKSKIITIVVVLSILSGLGYIFFKYFIKKRR